MVLLILLMGCPKSRVQRDDGMLAALDAVDDAWRARGRAGFEPVDRALEAARSQQSHHPGVQWRTARLAVSRGLMAQRRSDALRWYTKARDEAWACVLDDPQVAGLRLEIGLEAALAGLAPERQLCATWSAVGWTRWSLTFGADAAALDASRIATVVQSSSAVGDAALLSWAAAMLTTTGTAQERSTARSRLSAISRRQDDPTEGVALVDLYLWFDKGTDRGPQTRALLTSRGPASLETRAYLKRALDVTIEAW